MAFRHTIIGATAFHFRVRNGNGWCHCAMTTRRLGGEARPEVWGWGVVLRGSLTTAYRTKNNSYSSFVNMLGIDEMVSMQDKRMISTPQLNALLRLHRRPIDVVVFHDPSGKVYLRRSLALRCFQRLSLPHIAAQRCS
jgi:hypothetical protein